MKNRNKILAKLSGTGFALIASDRDAPVPKKYALATYHCNGCGHESVYTDVHAEDGIAPMSCPACGNTDVVKTSDEASPLLLTPTQVDASFTSVGDCPECGVEIKVHDDVVASLEGHHLHCPVCASEFEVGEGYSDDNANYIDDETETEITMTDDMDMEDDSMSEDDSDMEDDSMSEDDSDMGTDNEDGDMSDMTDDEDSGMEGEDVDMSDMSDEDAEGMEENISDDTPALTAKVNGKVKVKVKGKTTTAADLSDDDDMSDDMSDDMADDSEEGEDSEDEEMKSMGDDSLINEEQGGNADSVEVDMLKQTAKAHANEDFNAWASVQKIGRDVTLYSGGTIIAHFNAKKISDDLVDLLENPQALNKSLATTIKANGNKFSEEIKEEFGIEPVVIEVPVDTVVKEQVAKETNALRQTFKQQVAAVDSDFKDLVDLAADALLKEVMPYQDQNNNPVKVIEESLAKLNLHGYEEEVTATVIAAVKGFIGETLGTAITLTEEKATRPHYVEGIHDIVRNAKPRGRVVASVVNDVDTRAIKTNLSRGGALVTASEGISGNANVRKAWKNTFIKMPLRAAR